MPKTYLLFLKNAIMLDEPIIPKIMLAYLVQAYTQSTIVN